MKYLFSFLLLIFLSGEMTFASAPAYVNTAPTEAIVIRLCIEIHIARHRDCLGIGWCKVVTGYSVDPPSGERQAFATIQFNNENDLRVEIDKKTGLSPEAYEEFFSNGTFTFEDDFPMPREILEEMGHEDDFTIKAGKYQVTEKGDLIILIIQN